MSVRKEVEADVAKALQKIRPLTIALPEHADAAEADAAHLAEDLDVAALLALLESA